MADLVEVAEEMRAQGMELRVATKYNRLVRRFFLEKGLNFFSMVASTGAIEVAPTMGFADVIADLTSSGTTLRENGLKTLSDGTILNSQACLLGNLDALRRDPDAMATTKAILERMEACLRARDYFTVTANIRGESAEAVGMFVMNEPDVAGMQGPTVSKVYSRHEDGMEWYATTVVVRKDKLLRAVEHLRGVGGSGLTVSSPNYVFGAASEAYQRLLGALDRAPVA